MKVSELINKLSEFDPDAEVLITDGFKCLCYSGNYSINLFENSVDIGIGGCEDGGETKCC